MSDKVTTPGKVKLWFNGLNKREQRLIVGTVFLVPVFLFIQLIFVPGYERQQDLEKNYQQLLQDNTSLRAQVMEMFLLAEKDPDAENRQKLEQLQQEIARFDALLQSHMTGLVAPQDMPELLKTVLKKRPGLTLHMMQNGQSVAMSISVPTEQGEEQTAAEMPQVVLYRHPLHLELEGTYLDVLAYLQELRGLPQRVFWDGLQIEMEEQYPRARINVDVYTLSLEKGWISG